MRLQKEVQMSEEFDEREVLLRKMIAEQEKIN
jgi:hypothetical protein